MELIGIQNEVSPIRTLHQTEGSYIGEHRTSTSSGVVERPDHPCGDDLVLYHSVNAINCYEMFSSKSLGESVIQNEFGIGVPKIMSSDLMCEMFNFPRKQLSVCGELTNLRLGATTGKQLDQGCYVVVRLARYFDRAIYYPIVV